MILLPNEEKLLLLKAPQLHLTSKRIVQDGNSYGSINLRDITLIKTAYTVNIKPFILGIVTLATSFAFEQEQALYIGVGAFVVGLLFTLSSRNSTLDIHAPGSGSISASINFVDKKTVRNFISKIETEMERVKNGQTSVPVMHEIAG